MNDLLLDLRYALRTFRQRPGFTAVAVLTLALGIGSNSAIWSAVHGVLLTPLPYPEPERLVMIWEDRRADGGPEREWTGQATFQDWRRGNRSFAAVTAFALWQPNLTGDGEPERLPGAAVSVEYFDVLAVSPVRGRAFQPEEGRPGAAPVAVISDGLWRRRFGADPGLVGSSILLAGEPTTVVGILPAGFMPPFLDAQVFRPLQMADSPGDRGNFYLRVSRSRGRTPPAKGQEPAVWYRSATPDYFRTLGVPVVRGRSFDARDGAGAPPVAVINETMARRFFPGEDPVGRRIRLGGVDSKDPWRTILGVAADVRHDGPAAPTKEEIFFPLAQQPERSLTLLVRGADPLRLASAVRAEVAALDRNLPVAAMGTLEQALAGQIATPRLTTSLVAAFAAVALLLAAVGIYGVTAYAVAQRAHEIGVRVALGADRRHVLRHVVGRGMAPALAGLALGLALAYALTWAMASLLVGVSPSDPVTFAAVALLLAGVALVANYLPARRAARLDPVRVLKGE